MPDTLPIVSLVLYKHGISIITRRGRVAGRELSVPFSASEVDDALKSLTVIPLDGGQVSGIQYTTPRGTREVTPGSIFLRDDHTMFDLLRTLRGVPIALRLDGSTTIHGRLLGVEEHPQGREFGATLLLLTGDGSIEQIATDRITQLQIEDENVAAALITYLDGARFEDPRRSLIVSLTEADREVEITYAIPGPVWRVSYRFVGQGGGESATGLVQGWGILDNHLGEDLTDVEVALVAGQPVSFRYDLTSIVIPVRPLVHDEARVAAAPVEFAGALRRAMPMAAAAAPMHFDADDAQEMSAYRRSPRNHGREEQASTVQFQAESRELDELFEYRIPNVSVARDASAMLPIVQHTSEYRRELLYNGEKHPRHPVAALRFRNDSGLTLERGPVTITEDGEYRGEAILSFTKQGAEIVLAYAVELGVTVVEEHSAELQVEAVDLAGALLHIQEYYVQSVDHTLTNTTEQEQIVIVERRIRADLHETPDPDESTAEHRRWRVPCLPAEKTTFVVCERRLRSRQERIEDHSAAMLAAYLTEHGLNEESRTRISHILDLRNRLDHIDVQIEALHTEQQTLGAHQDRLRNNLSLQPQSEAEIDIRNRSAEVFRRTQDREDALLAEIEQLQAERSDVEGQLSEAMQ